MLDLSNNYKIAREAAAQGMVLLKNTDRVLPLGPSNKVGFIGKECLDLIIGGGGSGAVLCEYVKSLLQGLREKAEAGKFIFCEHSVELAAHTSEYDVDQLNALAEEIDVAIVTFRRFGTEGADRKLSKKSHTDMNENAYSGESNDAVIDDYEENVGYFDLSDKEKRLFENIERSNLQNVVVLLNIASTVDLSFLEEYPKLKSALLIYCAGMESGTAIADVLCGDTTPCGKLVDTIAYRYEDYPSSRCFDYDPLITEYKEGIYVGYRYFETFAKDKVLYPFGYGLSYTDFTYSNCAYRIEGELLILSADIKNTGKFSGKEIVQAYIMPPAGALEKPAIELKGYKKTRELAPGQCEHIEISFPLKNMASFDETGATGHTAAWVMEKGSYELFLGKSIRELFPCGTYQAGENVVTEQLQLRFDGSTYEMTELESSEWGRFKSEMSELEGTYDLSIQGSISLYDVADNKATLGEFINQLSVDELIHLSQGQPPAFPLGTSGIGNLKKYGVPNPQTADGPAGIRRSVSTTYFPCSTLAACSWDEELQYEIGRAMGYEGYHTGVDILLAPAMNIHRNPLCGRNFEYFSEDPLITGKTAAALVKGVQSEGLCATIKHFAANNCEYHRFKNNSIVSERALREIYLKGFEITIKEANPAFVMTSYNLINRFHASNHSQLLRGVLRDEWKYDGAVMTDWRNSVSLDDEIVSGNNIKMPFGYPDETQKAVLAYQNGKITTAILRENAYYVLKAIMKTRRFQQKDFGITHVLEKHLVIPAIQANGLSSTRIKQEPENGEWYLYSLGKDIRAQRTFLLYSIDAASAGVYTITCRVGTNCPRSEIWLFDEDDRKLGSISLHNATDEQQWYDVQTTISLQKGEHILKVVFADEPDKEYDYYPSYPSFYPLQPEDIRLSRITLEDTNQTTVKE